MIFRLTHQVMSRWRKRLSEEGCELLLQEMLKVGVKTKVVKTEHMKQVIIDTTVQEKAISYPTDSKLFHTSTLLVSSISEKEWT